jgi:hypothetical protein
LDYQAKSLKAASQACPETLCVPTNSYQHRCTTAPHYRYTKAPQHDLGQQTKPMSRQSVRSASASPSGLRALARGNIGDQGTPLFEPSGEFGVTPQWCTSTKLPAQRAAVRLAGALRTLWRKVIY